MRYRSTMGLLKARRGSERSQKPAGTLVSDGGMLQPEVDRLPDVHLAVEIAPRGVDAEGAP